MIGGAIGLGIGFSLSPRRNMPRPPRADEAGGLCHALRSGKALPKHLAEFLYRAVIGIRNHRKSSIINHSISQGVVSRRLPLSFRRYQTGRNSETAVHAAIHADVKKVEVCLLQIGGNADTAVFSW